MADEPVTGASAAAITAAPVAPVQAPPAAVLAATKADTILAVINRWRDERLGGGPIARSTEAWNQLQAELPGLADAIAKDI